MWDYNVGLVRMTPFFKSCKYSKVCSDHRSALLTLTRIDHTSEGVEPKPWTEKYQLQYHRRSSGVPRLVLGFEYASELLTCHVRLLGAVASRQRARSNVLLEHPLGPYPSLRQRLSSDVHSSPLPLLRQFRHQPCYSAVLCRRDCSVQGRQGLIPTLSTGDTIANHIIGGAHVRHTSMEA